MYALLEKAAPTIDLADAKGGTWKHGYIPTNAIAVAEKQHGVKKKQPATKRLLTTKQPGETDEAFSKRLAYNKAVQTRRKRAAAAPKLKPTSAAPKAKKPTKLRVMSARDKQMKQEQFANTPRLNAPNSVTGDGSKSTAADARNITAALRDNLHQDAEIQRARQMALDAKTPEEKKAARAAAAEIARQKRADLEAARKEIDELLPEPPSVAVTRKALRKIQNALGKIPVPAVFKLAFTKAHTKAQQIKVFDMLQTVFLTALSTYTLAKFGFHAAI